MKFKSLAFFVGCSFFLSSFAFAAGETITYKNTRGSELKLQFLLNNSVTGTFTTAVASKDCQQAIGVERPIMGFTAKNSLGFIVNYPECGSVVTFIGNIEEDKSLIDTTAIVAHPSVHIAKEGPGARMISHDMFMRVDSDDEVTSFKQ